MGSRAAVLREAAPSSRPLGGLTRGARVDDLMQTLLPELAGHPGADHGVFRAPPDAGRRSPRLSLVVRGADAPTTRPDLSAPDHLLEQTGWETPDLLARARAAMAALATMRVGGAWWAPDPGAAALGLPSGCALVAVGGATPGTADRLLDRALAAHPADRVVVVLTAPTADWPALAARAAGLGCRVVERAVNPWSLLDAAGPVFAADPELGFLALVAGHPVHCADRPFFAGWGATIDGPDAAPRAHRRTAEEIFAATCLLATRYADPFARRLCSFEDMLALVGDWRRVNEANRAIAVCLGMSFWKRRRVADFLASSDGSPRFLRRPAPAVRLAQRRGGMAAVWASREPAGLRAAAAAAGVPVLTVEDGFLRSVGLGADFMPAASLVVDRGGIYYDPTKPSDLERILAKTTFDDALVERARRLIGLLVARGITKYNIGGAAPELGAPAGAHRILVPGQVEDDRSVALGGAGITRNLELLERVRHSHPDAFIVYKPHPDVDAGHRRGAIPDETAAKLADRIVRGVSSAALLTTVDAVHTLTSLVGFEGLLRGRRVVVYGQPFYAGWGVTDDRVPPPRRGRNLTIEQLVAGTLILYPRYLDPVTRLPCGPEVIIDRLSDPSLWRAGPLVTVRRLQGAVMRRLAAWTVRP
jgi:capsular polysaccharide export protein